MISVFLYVCKYTTYIGFTMNFMRHLSSALSQKKLCDSENLAKYFLEHSFINGF